MSVVESGEYVGTQALRTRLSGSVVKGVGMLEYFETGADAIARRDEIILDAPGANLTVEQVTCILDDDGEVLAELEQ